MKPLLYILPALLLIFTACNKNEYSEPTTQQNSPADSSHTVVTDSTKHGDTPHVGQTSIINIVYEGQYFYSHYHLGMIYPSDTAYTALLNVRETTTDTVTIVQTDFNSTNLYGSDILKIADKNSKYFSKSDGRNGYTCRFYGDSVYYIAYMNSSMIGWTHTFKGRRQLKNVSIKNTY